MVRIITSSICVNHCWWWWCSRWADDKRAAERTAHSVSASKMKITMAVTDTKLAITGDLLKPDPVAVVIEVGRVILLW